MLWILCLQLIFARDNCLDLRYKVESTLKYGFVSIDFNKRNAKIWLPPKLRIYGQDYVQMDEYGFPDFMPFSIYTIKFETTGDRESDYRLSGFPRRKGYDRHHSLDGYLMLVPHEIHQFVPHEGSIHMWKVNHGY
jgi:hypothetical protein